MYAQVRLSLVATLLGMTSTGSLFAHDMWLVTGVPGARGRVCARIGEHFPVSSNGVAADRVDIFQVRSEAGAKPLTGVEGKKQLCAMLPASSPAGVAEIIVHPRFIRLDAKDFNSYIEGEGFASVIAGRKRDGKDNAEGRELYSRFSKLLVGKVGDLATRPLGHVLEIVPEKDPASLAAGEPLSVRVLFRGKPLAGVRVSAAYAGAEMKGHDFPVTAETDAQGRALLKLDRGGLWYARLIHMIPAQDDPEVDWRSFFATLTFEIPGK
ncbi:MAG: DUF4198 domain-containing protein [Terriglobales bacterium]